MGISSELLEIISKVDRVSYYYASSLIEESKLSENNIFLYNVLNKRLYNLFLSLIDEKYSSKLRNLDWKINDIIFPLCKNKRVAISNKGITIKANLENEGDPDFEQYDILIINRNKDGFYVKDNFKDYNPYFANLYIDAIKFLNENNEELNKLHELYLDKEKIMGGGYTIKYNNDSRLLYLIGEHLGYKQEKEAVVELRLNM